MRKLIRWAAAVALWGAVTTAPGAATAAPQQDDLRRQAELREKFDRRREGALKVGDAAPEFAVQDISGKTTVRLAELRGKPVVLVFGSCT